MKKGFNQVDKNTFVSEDGTVMFHSQYIDEDGNAIERTPESHQYSYDPYVTWRGGENEEVDDVVYSDRLHQWDGKKYDELCKKHFGDEGQWFSGRTPESIEAFLRDYNNNQNIKLILIMQGCNVSSGYPFWTFHFKK